MPRKQCKTEQILTPTEFADQQGTDRLSKLKARGARPTATAPPGANINDSTYNCE
jgi:hypothetical protein